MNAREGIKTQGTFFAALGRRQLKTMNAREGIKTLPKHAANR